MLHKYRKTALIEAEQFDDSDEMIRRYRIKYYSPGNEYSFYTKEGASILNIGDWIATGIDGEHWRIESDIFERTYERIN